MDRHALSWRAEEACLNARPSSRQMLMGGWLLRAAGGPLRQTNSVNPLQYGLHDPAPVLADCEAIYGALDQSVLFRIPSMAADADPVLEALGYSAEGRSLTLFADMDARAASAASFAVELSEDADAPWRALRSKVNGEDAEAAAIFRTMIGLIVAPKVFAAVRSDRGTICIAYGVIDRGLLVVEAVATHAEERGRGLAQATVAALMDWAEQRGCKGACLQVVADNSPAVAAYRKLGFTTELYQYHYRRMTLASPWRPSTTGLGEVA